MKGKPAEPARLRRERRTIEAMVRLNCTKRHGGRGELCEECGNLLDYAVNRLDQCPFGAGKPTCARCPVHCFRPDMRERVRGVMRFAGPRMTFRHPMLAVLHLADGRRSAKAGRPGAAGSSGRRS